jgi:hypothetical protein
MGQYVVRHRGLVALTTALMVLVGVSSYNFQRVQFAQRVNPLWLALTRDIDFSRPDSDELKLQAAIMKSEGLPRHQTTTRP